MVVTDHLVIYTAVKKLESGFSDFALPDTDNSYLINGVFVQGSAVSSRAD